MKARDGLHRVSVKFGGVVLQCEGMYWAGSPGDMTDPPEPEMFEFTYVKHRDEDVLELLGDDRVAALAIHCIGELK